MENTIALLRRACMKYPNVDSNYRPSTPYPEYPWPDAISTEPNEVYDMVRESFLYLGLDRAHIGTPEWNPLSDVIRPGDKVVVKPNLVMHKNYNPTGGVACLYTHPSVTAAVLDYVILALHGTGSIVVGDAPVQECDFERLMRESGYARMLAFYREKNVCIQCKDFRELTSRAHLGIVHSTLQAGRSGVVVNLDANSEFAVCNESYLKRLRITNYNPALLHSKHDSKHHQYYICKDVLEADVLINLPKPKTHRKAGITAALKNMVGINARKEYLPHHANGAILQGGDEYANSSRLKETRDWLLDQINKLASQKKYVFARFFQAFLLANEMLIRCFLPDTITDGSWSGNHTIYKTILDLNKILLYADRNGTMQPNRQRKILIVADMIVMGEKNGPMAPSPKDAGIIMAGTDPVAFDEVVATIMGADIAKIPSIANAHHVLGAYSLSAEQTPAQIRSNEPLWNEKTYRQIDVTETLCLHSAKGWETAFAVISKDK